MAFRAQCPVDVQIGFLFKKKRGVLRKAYTASGSLRAFVFVCEVRTVPWPEQNRKLPFIVLLSHRGVSLRDDNLDSVSRNGLSLSALSVARFANALK